MTEKEISTTATSILAGAAAACGPAGAPAFIFLSSLSVLLGQYGGKDDNAFVTIEEISQATRSILTEVTAREAWSKIRPSYGAYSDYTNRAASGEAFSERDLKYIDQMIFAGVGPNSDLIQGLTLLYDREQQPHELSYVEHSLPVYLLGVSILMQLHLLDIARQHGNGETITSYQWLAIAEKAKNFAAAIQRIRIHVSSYTIEAILHKELTDGKFKLGSQALKARNQELIAQYLGGEREVLEAIHDLFTIERRMREAAQQALAGPGSDNPEPPSELEANP